MRNAAARAVEAVIAAIGQLLATNTPQQRANYFTHAGYDKPDLIPLYRSTS